MKKLILSIFLSSLSIFPQFRITLLDQEIPSYGEMVLTVFAQNLGNSQKIWALYGDNYSGSVIAGRSNFVIYYDDIMNDNKTRNSIPSSIIIKTIFDTYIPMDSPMHNFPSTGSKSGQEWVITFTGIPNDAAHVRVSVLGTTFQVGDMPEAQDSRIRKTNKFINLLNQARESTTYERWNKAADIWNDLILLDSEIITKYSEEICISFCEKGKILFAENNFSEAVNYFEEAKKINENEFRSYLDDYSDLLYAYGLALIKDSKVDQGIKNFLYSHSISDINRKNIENSLNTLKISRFTSTCLSIIPGFSQLIYQKNSIKSVLFFGTFFLSSGLAVLSKKNADIAYEEYLNAKTPTDAEQKYNLANGGIILTGVLGGLALATVLYSVIDQLKETSKFNSKFEIQLSINNTYAPYLESYSFLLKIPL